MFSHFKANPFIRFLLIATVLYCAWYGLYEFYLHKHTHFDDIVIHQIVVCADSTLRLFEYTTTDFSSVEGTYRQFLGIEGSKGVVVGAPCDGVVLYVLFIFFVVAFPGPLKHKLWFVPVGAFTIFYLNVLRVAALAVIMSVNEDWLAFNHDYTFTILVYSYVFALWVLWVRKFSPYAQIKDGK